MSKTQAGEKANLHRVAIVDDHTLMREGVQLFIESLPGFTCIWTAGSAREAVGKLEQTPPDLLVVDISLPDRNGLELVKDVVAMKADLPILVLSMHDEKLYALRALRAGAKGYVMKNASHQVLEASLRRVASGGIGVSPAVSEMVIGAYSSGGKVRPEEGLHSLSDREFEVFQLIGEGQSTNQIAESLRISPKTVDVHRMNIRMKLNLEDGAALTRWAIRWTESRRHDRE
ncbi:MAG: response regulator transcription factor [Verrucomicrobiales bacterium]|nr:response regulator transcription factor [Verrucomicrobiales bacterium]